MSCVYFRYQPHTCIELYIIYYAGYFCYYGIGFILWAAFLIFMKVKNKISVKEMVINIALVVLGVSLAYVCFNYNVFDLNGYLD